MIMMKQTYYLTNMNNEDLFKAWYSDLPKSEYRQKRQEIIEQCRISRAVFYNWLSGSTPIPPCHYNTINSIAGQTLLKAKL